MDILSAVEDYIAQNLSVIPIIKASKRPDAADWTTKNFQLSDFTVDHGVAIRIDSGHVDVDLDEPEAAQAATMLMPATRVHGRLSNPGSHWWYKCPLDKSLTFKDLDGTMLMEARTGNKHYTILPPSIHESGEPYVWENSVPFLQIDVPDFLTPLRATAIAALFGRHWPEGSRHFAAAHLAGFLLRCGFDALTVVQIVRAAATIGKDDEIGDRVRAAKDTCEKHEQGAKTTGGPKLKTVFDRGDELARRVYDWLGHEGSDLLDEFNERHFAVRVGAKHYVATEEVNLIAGQPVNSLTLQPHRDFVERHINRKVGKVSAGDWWLRHPARRTMDGIVFAPPPIPAGPDVYNTYRGFSVEPDEQPDPALRCALFLQHMHHVICQGNDYHFAYLLDWCALTVQRPGESINVAVVMRGGSGSGKGSFASNFGSLFNPAHYLHITQQSTLIGRFNSSLSRRVVVFADEAVWAGSKQDSGNLKRLITERTIEVEAKYRDAITEPNCVHLIMATNEDWVWPATFKERRGFILDVPNHPKFKGAAYFDALHEEWADGGAAAFLALLLARPVARRLGPVPITDALIDQQDLTMTDVQAWWANCLDLGEIEPGKGWPTFVPFRTLFHEYYAEHHTQKYERRSSEVWLARQLVPLLPKPTNKRKRTAIINTAPTGKQPVWTEQRCNGYMLPPLSECRAAFDELTGSQRQWDPIDEEQPELPEGEL